MLIIEQVLEEEYWRSLDISEALEGQLSALPQGDIKARIVGGRVEHCLRYREGDAVRFHRIDPQRLDILRRAIEQRDRILRILRDQEETRKIIVRGLGRIPDGRSEDSFSS